MRHNSATQVISTVPLAPSEGDGRPMKHELVMISRRAGTMIAEVRKLPIPNASGGNGKPFRARFLTPYSLQVSLQVPTHLRALLPTSSEQEPDEDHSSGN